MLGPIDSVGKNVFNISGCIHEYDIIKMVGKMSHNNKKVLNSGCDMVKRASYYKEIILDSINYNTGTQEVANILVGQSF